MVNKITTNQLWNIQIERFDLGKLKQLKNYDITNTGKLRLDFNIN